MTLDLTFLPLTVAKTVPYIAANPETYVLDLGPFKEADHVTIQLEFVDADGDPVDVSAWTGMTFAAFTAAGAQAFTMSPAFTTDGTNGRVDVALTVTQLTGMGGDAYTHEMQATGVGLKLTPLRGAFAVTPTYS